MRSLNEAYDQIVAGSKKPITSLKEISPSTPETYKKIYDLFNGADYDVLELIIKRLLVFVKTMPPEQQEQLLHTLIKE